MDNYKAYSLQELEVWVREAMEADCTPSEVYASIIDTVKNNMKYHRACYRDSVRLLSLLRGHRNQLEIHEGKKSEMSLYWEGSLEGKEFENAQSRYGYAFTPTTITGNVDLTIDDK
jgi:hypothetical protein